MFSMLRKHSLIVSLSGILAGTMAKEIVLQNGLNDYDGCSDATISFSGPIKLDGDDEMWGDKDTNFHELPYLHAHFCPT